MPTPAARLAAWVDALFQGLEEGEPVLDFGLLEALAACGPLPAVEGWLERYPVALSRSLIWADMAQAGRVGALERAEAAAVSSPHPLPAIDLVRRFGPRAVPAALAHLERIADRAGEWCQGAHAVIAGALWAEEAEAAQRHLEVALRDPPSFPAKVDKHRSALEAVILAASLARLLKKLGRDAETHEQRARALDRLARGRGADYEDRHARFDLAEEEGIADVYAVHRAVSDFVFDALAEGSDVVALREVSITRVAGALAAVGRLEEARALVDDDANMRWAVWAAIASFVRDPEEAERALADPSWPSPEELHRQHEEGLLDATERSVILLNRALAYGRRGRAAEGIALIAPLLDEARQGWAEGLREVRAPLAAALQGRIMEPWAVGPQISDADIQRYRKRRGILRAIGLLDAAASRPGPEGAALLEEALACDRGAHDMERRFAAYAVHGRLAAAHPIADTLYAGLEFGLPTRLDGLSPFVLALHAAGRHDEAARELDRWIDLPPHSSLFAAVLAVAEPQGALAALAGKAAAALGRIDARVDAVRL